MSIVWIDQLPNNVPNIRFVDQGTGNYTKKHHTKSGIERRSVYYKDGTPEQQLVFSAATNNDLALDPAVEAHMLENET